MKIADLVKHADPDCPKCGGRGFICEAHPGRPWPHDECPGNPCDASGCVLETIDERNMLLLRLTQCLRLQRARYEYAAIQSFDDAEAFIGCHTDSYSRLGTIIDLFWRLDDDDVLRLLGQWWTLCDNIARYRDELVDLLPAHPTRHMMTEDEWQALMALPARKEITIYRGADRGVNEDGISWSLNRATAERFPCLNRYRAKNPVLVTATVKRNQITALKLDRKESEVITLCARVRGVESLTKTDEPTAAAFAASPT